MATLTVIAVALLAISLYCFIGGIVADIAWHIGPRSEADIVGALWILTVPLWLVVQVFRYPWALGDRLSVWVRRKLME